MVAGFNRPVTENIQYEDDALRPEHRWTRSNERDMSGRDIIMPWSRSEEWTDLAAAQRWCPWARPVISWIFMNRSPRAFIRSEFAAMI